MKSNKLYDHGMLSDINLVDILVPPLYSMVRLPHIPTNLKSSALSLLATCESTAPLALTQYSTDLLDGMIDLLQVESVAASEAPPQKTKESPIQVEGSASRNEAAGDALDAEPLSSNPKLAPLRRAALHFLTLLIRSRLSAAYDGQSIREGESVMKRARITLAYLASTDADNVVRIMAREALELLQNLQEVALHA